MWATVAALCQKIDALVSPYFGPLVEGAMVQQEKRITPYEWIDKEVDKIQEHLDHRDTSNIRWTDYNLVDWDGVYATGPNGTKGKKYGRLYLGSARALYNRKFMKNIGAVVSIIDPQRCPEQSVNELIHYSLTPVNGAHEPYPKKALLYLPLDDDPNENIAKYFDKSYRFIHYYHSRNIPVFVHCMAGISRSSTIVANYLMKKYGLTALKALDILQKRRPVVYPNSGFIRQLVEEEHGLRQKRRS